MNQISYLAGYKYQLVEKYCLKTDITPAITLNSQFIILYQDGTLCIASGYAWNGATGFADDDTILRGSLIHDALYQLMREGTLDISFKDKADRELQAICIEDGMAYAFSELVYQAVHLLGKPYITTPKVVLHAPVGDRQFEFKDSAT